MKRFAFLSALVGLILLSGCQGSTELDNCLQQNQELTAQVEQLQGQLEAEKKQQSQFMELAEAALTEAQQTQELRKMVDFLRTENQRLKKKITQLEE